MNLDMSVVFINLLELFLLIAYAPEFVGAMDMDWKDREKSQDQDS